MGAVGTAAFIALSRLLPVVVVHDRPAARAPGLAEGEAEQTQREVPT
jgi:hypothetical protein